MGNWSLLQTNQTASLQTRLVIPLRNILMRMTVGSGEHSKCPVELRIKAWPFSKIRWKQLASGQRRKEISATSSSVKFIPTIQYFVGMLLRRNLILKIFWSLAQSFAVIDSSRNLCFLPSSLFVYDILLNGLEPWSQY